MSNTDPGGLRPCDTDDCGTSHNKNDPDLYPWPSSIPENDPLKLRIRVSYDRKAAVAYAKQWSNSGNPDYPAIIDTDCTNFVSQILAVGGLKPNRYWYPDQGSLFGASRSWTYAPALRDYLVITNGLPTARAVFGKSRVPPNTPVFDFMASLRFVQTSFTPQEGDVIFFYNLDQTLPHHAAIISKWDHFAYHDPHNNNEDITPTSVRNSSQTIPWMIDHSGRGFERPINDVSHEVKVEIVHIPDQFDLVVDQWGNSL